MVSNSNRQLRLGAILSYVAIGVNILAALLYSPWMLSEIGSSDYGLYMLATALINMFLLDFGMSSAVTRFTSKYLAEGKQDKVGQLLGVVYKLFIVIAVIICAVLIIVYFFIDSIYLSLSPEEIERFKIVYVISAAYSVVSFPFTVTLNGILTSYEKFVQLRLCDIGNKLITILLTVIALLSGQGLYALVAVNAAMNLACFCAKWLFIRKLTPARAKLRFWDRELLREIFGFSVWVLVNSICSRLIMNICPNILGVTAGTIAITCFSFASVIEGYTYTFASAIDNLFMPRIARIAYGEKDMSKILPLMIKVGRFQFQLVGLIVIGFIVVGREFIFLWIGPEYEAVYYCAVLLVLPAPFYMAQQIGKNTMVMTDNVKYLAYINIVKAALNVALVSLLSVYWGVVGACASICVVYFFRNLAQMYIYRKKLSLDIKAFSKQCYQPMSAPMIITLVLSLVLQSFCASGSWLLLGAKILAITAVYFSLMWFFAYDKNEKRAVSRVFKKRKEDSTK